MKKAFLIATLCILASCGNENKSEPSQITNEVQPIQSNLEQLKTEASRLRGGGSVSNVELENGKATISYVKNYAEYQQLNPQSKLTENDLREYWSTGHAIQKALISGSGAILKKNNFINEVEIILPFENKIYKIDVKKTELEKFTGKDFSQITNNWTKDFVDPYVYDKAGRELFFNKFGSKN
ncbi:hypothetical protein [Chryseobacterium jejuense]|uniref:Uncharacterized protein n=1 Tax=Chryseobacterium jejuense TaxID=445960 RepID=A0ABY0Q0X3_CHRJE|nr:hypothetical protein [Chryseobacterium jejuense]SDJ31290.1 hypothetical protein SAMN05421542_3151 [Chryseobacterium jejuense]